MEFTLNSRISGKLEFFAPNGGGYVRLTSGEKPGTLGQQICERGGFMGSTLSCGPDIDSLARVARKWQKQRLQDKSDD